MDLIASAVVIVLGIALFVPGLMVAPRTDRKYVLLSFVMHYVFSASLYGIMEYVFGSCDVHIYMDEAEILMVRLNESPGKWILEIFKLVCQLPNEILEPTPSGSMVGMTALGMYLTGSIWAMFFLFATLSFFGKWALYTALRDELKFADPRPLFVSAMFIPSCVFWTSGLVKEAFAISGLGFLFRGTQLLLRGVNVTAFLLVPAGFILIGGFKPFFLFAFVLATAVWVVFSKMNKRLIAFAPIIFGIVMAGAIVGLAVLGTKYKEFAIDRVAETVAEHQFNGMRGEGGSNYHMGDPNARSIGGQIVWAPLALFTTLARPLPFEVHNVTSSIAAGELLILSIVLFRSVRRTGVRRAWSNVVARPVLLFAFVFTLVASTAVGLATTNFGTLSRYRTPILPFYAALIVGIRHAERTSNAPAKAPARPGRLPIRNPALARAVAARKARQERSLTGRATSG